MSVDGEKTTHESFGVATVVRTSGHATLFQSPHKHQHYITLEFRQASVERKHSNNYVFSRGLPLLSVSMSEAQWAHFVASAGIGSGTPCTVNALRTGDYHSCEDPPEEEHSRQTFAKEARERGERAISNVREAIGDVQRMLAPDGKRGKAELKELLSKLNVAVMEAGSNLGFVMEQFEEDMDKNLNAAKTELEAHGLAVVHTLGLAAVAKRITPEEEERLATSLAAPLGDLPKIK